MRRPLCVALLLAALLVPACDAFGADESPAPSASPPVATSPPPTLSAEGFLFTSKQGIRALATFRGDRGTLDVENGTGADLAAPGVYLLDALTGEVVHARVAPAHGIADGDERAFRVTLARPMPPASIGLVVLTIGGEDHGAFLPPAAAEVGG